MSRMKSLLLLLALSAQVPLVSAKVTYAVGACQPTLASFTTIQGALSATPPPNVVEVCPGTYAEQIVITIPVTLEGISSGNLTGATISVPSGGLAFNASGDQGEKIAAQVWVDNVGGEVNLSNLTVDGTGNNITENYIVGVFYQNTPGIANHLTVQNQKANGGLDTAVWFEGGSANPVVALENSVVQGFYFQGINAEANSGASEITVTIRGNYVTGIFESQDAMGLGDGATGHVTGNLIAPGSFQGIVNAEGSISNNTVIGGIFYGIVTHGASVTSNRLYGSSDSDAPEAAIWVNSSVAQVTGNTITESGAYGNAIDFVCTAGDNVHSNTILGAANALLNVGTGADPINTIYSAITLRGSDTTNDCL